jgi:NADH dehydrogenase FAD-containing subunit
LSSPHIGNVLHLRPTRNGVDPQVIIVGAGFGGLTAARALKRATVDITLVDRRNHHLSQPLLYQVAAAGLSPAEIAWPIRRLFRRQPNVRVLLGEVTGVDRERKLVRIGARSLLYDMLIVATGASHAYFGHDGWAPHAPGLKSIEDATEIRRRILLAFERAEMESDPAERCRLLTPRWRNADGQPLPGIAPVAKQQGAYVARVTAVRDGINLKRHQGHVGVGQGGAPA